MQVLLEEWAESAKAFVLQGVDEFMEDEAAVAPPIGVDEDSVSQREANGIRGEKSGRVDRGAKDGMLRDGDTGDAQKADLFRMGQADFFRILKLSRSKSSIRLGDSHRTAM